MGLLEPCLQEWGGELIKLTRQDVCSTFPGGHLAPWWWWPQWSVIWLASTCVKEPTGGNSRLSGYCLAWPTQVANHPSIYPSSISVQFCILPSWSRTSAVQFNSRSQVDLHSSSSSWSGLINTDHQQLLPLHLDQPSDCLNSLDCSLCNTLSPPCNMNINN